LKFGLSGSILWFALGIWLLSGSAIVYGQSADIGPGVKIATAIRVNSEPPRIDGVLDDEVWQQTPIHEGFLQSDPNEGEKATERTAFQIVYDDEAIYFGILCHDKEPGQIVSRLTRRDGRIEADWVSISLDPHYDRQTGYWFGVYASGSVTDGTFSDDRMRDDTWDGVWEVETSFHDQGWSAEYRIPYYVLRFSPKEEYVWGMNIERNICRKKEWDQWMLNRKGEPGLVSKFGRLEGIRGIQPPIHLEFVPYAMGRTIVDDETDYFGGMGADIRYGITSGVSLNATINPDFGQVEADPARLNLTAFEDFFPERRPFFVEGASLFRNWDYGLFHSRRIGKRPGYFPIPEDAEEVEASKETTILGAAKLTGKTESKTAFGFIEAVTAPEYATIEHEVNGETVREEHLLEPLTNYFVGRMQQDVLSGTSKVGLMTTAVHRRDAESAYVGAVDWDLKFNKDTYNFTGTLVGSRAGESDDRKSGYISHVEFDKRGGWLEVESGVAAISPGLNVNDLGFVRRNDLIRSWVRTGLYHNTPLGPFRSFDVSGSGQLAWNYDGLRLENGFDVSSWGELKSYWGVHIHFGRNFAAMNDDDVLRDGPVIKSPADYFVHAMINTDNRKIVSFSLRPERRGSDDGRTYSNSLDFGVEIRPLSNVWFLIEPSYGHRVYDAQWIERIEEEIDGQKVVHYVYGELDSRTLDLTTRARISFTPEISLEFYLQPFIAIGDYENFKELVEEKTYEFRPFSFDENWDFHHRSLKSNMVLRWEFQPRSTLFAVWSQSRDASLEDLTEEDLEFRPFDRLRSSFSDEGSNVFLIKLNYWLVI
jgi:hypothetical protein